MDWLASKKVDAVNMSVAGGDNKVVRKALDIANRQKLLLIAAVGNWGRSDKPAYPAAYKEVVAVTAIKGGELIYSHANTGKYVDFAAPDGFNPRPGRLKISTPRKIFQLAG